MFDRLFCWFQRVVISYRHVIPCIIIIIIGFIKTVYTRIERVIDLINIEYIGKWRRRFVLSLLLFGQTKRCVCVWRTVCVCTFVTGGDTKRTAWRQKNGVSGNDVRVVRHVQINEGWKTFNFLSLLSKNKSVTSTLVVLLVLYS